MALFQLRTPLFRNLGIPFLGGMILLVAAACSNGAAEEKSAAPAVSEEIKQAIANGIAKARPMLKVASVEPSPVPGLYKTEIENGPILFVSADGQYVLATDMYKVELGHFVNLQEADRQALRVALAKELDENQDDLIVYSPKGEVKGVVNVFTDVDCGYCQRLHQEVGKLNEMGIELRYLAYPRAGIGSPSYEKIATAWCAKDRNAAMDQLKARKSLPINVCKDNPVAEQYAIGNRIGVNGTPAILLDDGTLLPGYLPARELAARIGVVDPAQ
ncbi:thioredoxin fold domain-containing protein [Halioxenophilus sp. WMMB6]|uniref:thioredoxin fold domain-containing protein n=1 Tax=Halioxenophilus sp. WMMB6 TaxID=3073815 RepID=UPI00295E830A|nr:thioredoxin fold domain-containing protein [Halioxenophilus sp. WMMB6]